MIENKSLKISHFSKNVRKPPLKIQAIWYSKRSLIKLHKTQHRLLHLSLVDRMRDGLWWDWAGGGLGEGSW